MEGSKHRKIMLKVCTYSPLRNEVVVGEAACLRRILKINNIIAHV